MGTLGTLGTFTWEPGNLYLGPWEPLLGNLYLGTWEPLLGTLGTFTWEPLLGNLGTFTWEPLLGTLGTFTWEPLLGNLGTFTWNLGTLGEWVLELLRSAPKPLRWLKTPKHSAVGEKALYWPIYPHLKYNHEKVASSRSELPDTRKFSGLKSNAFCIHYKTHQMQLRKPDHAADHNGDQASRRGGQSADHEGIQQLEAFVWIMTGI